ncbi:MAG: P-loop NTPase [Coriobacteriales bacterium]|jgi:pilus assembly protein CpaE|nr:P-loop NTPase [Coriobacteriales bacterium]
MNEQVVAYSFTPPSQGGDGSLGGGGQSGDSMGDKGSITMFASSEQCRAVLRHTPSMVPVVVCNGAGTVTPINLAAALCADAPERDVYLMEDVPTESLAYRAYRAGIRGILDHAQVEKLLAVGRGRMVPVGMPASEPASEFVRVPFRVPAPEPVPASAPEPPSQPVSEPVPAPAMALSPASSPEPVLGSASVRVHEASPKPASEPVPVPPPSGQGRIVGVFSGRGGVGKSTVSLMAALAAQRRGMSVALVDLDLQFGDMDYLAGKEPAGRIRRLPLAQLCAQQEMPPLPDDGLVLVSAPEQPEQGERLVSAIPSLLDRLSSQRDLVVLNTGSFWMDVHAQVAQQCDHLVFLMDQRATSIEACKQAVDLCLRLQTPQARFHYLLNGCGRHAALTVQDVSLALGGVEVCGLADGGSLVDELLALGCPWELLTSGNAFVSSLEDFLDGLVGYQALSLVEGELWQTSGQASGQPSGHKARIFDLAALRGFFEGARRVAP